MIKVICCILFLLIGAFVFNEPPFLVFIRAFGYEGTPSVFFLLACMVALGYIWYLLGAPGRWIQHFKQRRIIHHVLTEQEQFEHILTAYFVQDTAEQHKILKKISGPLAPIVTALFVPQKTLFEQMKQAGIHKTIALKGLYDAAFQQGDTATCRLMLTEALTICPQLKWVQMARLNQALADHNMPKALDILDILKKNNFITKDEYIHQKSLVFLRQGDVKKAYHLAPKDIEIILAYCAQVPHKAKKILLNAFEQNPDERLYKAYKELLTDESPLQKIKAVNVLTQAAPMDKISLFAKADIALSFGLWGVAKENLESYLNAFALTPQTALMMAQIEREGFHHPNAAQAWEQKAFDML